MALISKSFNLDMTPGVMPPVINVSEYDVNRQIIIFLRHNGGAFTPAAGTTAKIEGTLSNGFGFSEDADLSGNSVSFTLTESMTAVAGRAWVKVKLTNDGAPVSSAAFILDCDRAGVEADTVIGASGFQAQINEGVAEYFDNDPPFFELPSGGQSGQALVSDGEGGAEWGQAGVEVDATLSIEGAAADAAAVGEQLTIAAPGGTQIDIPITGYWWRKVSAYPDNNIWAVSPQNNYHCYAFNVPTNKNIEVSVSGTHNRFAIIGKSDIIDAETVPTETITGFTLIYRQDSESTYSFNSGSYRTIVLYLCASSNDQPTVSVIQKSNAETIWLKEYVEELAENISDLQNEAVLTSATEYTSTEKETARENIDAASVSDVRIDVEQTETDIQGTMWNASGFSQDLSGNTEWEVNVDSQGKTYAFNADRNRDVTITVEGTHNRFCLLASQDSLDTANQRNIDPVLYKIYRDDSVSTYSFNTGNYRSFFLYVALNQSTTPSVSVAYDAAEGSITIPLKTVVAELISKVDELSSLDFHAESLLPPTQGIKSTASDYFALWEPLVTAGYCTKTQIATVNGQPIYKYVFAVDKDTLYNDALTIVSDGSFYKKPKVSFISGQHGDEKGGPLFTYEFFNHVCNDPTYHKYLGMFDFHVIPLVNPTGYNANTRNNYQNVNINRDATNSPSSVEGQALKTHFDSYTWAACFDIHQTSKNQSHSFNWTCGYYTNYYGAPKTVTDRFNRLFTKVGYETERLMEKGYNKPHAQMFQPWEWGVYYDAWVNYVIQSAKTNLSFVVETAQAWSYYNGSFVDLNQDVLIGGNTFMDKIFRAFLDNIFEGLDSEQEAST